MTTCSNCSKEIEESAKFCPWCGTPAQRDESGEFKTVTEIPAPPPISGTPPPAPVPPIMGQPLPPSGPLLPNQLSPVTFFRHSNYLGCAVNMIVLVNGVQSAQISNGNSATLMLPPGNHLVQIKWAMWEAMAGQTMLNVQPGKNYRVDLTIKWSITVYQVNFAIYVV